MTNNWTDIGNSTLIIVMGANPSENHPACMSHINNARRGPHTWKDGADNEYTSSKPAAKLVVIDPRKTRTACLADTFIRIRPGTDIAFINGVINYIIGTGTGLNAPANANKKARWESYHAATASRTLVKDDGTTGGVTMPRYTDAKLKVRAASAANADYERPVSHASHSNLPVIASSMYDDDTVYKKLAAHVAPYTLSVTAGICDCVQGDIIDVANLVIANSRCSSVAADGDGFGSTLDDPKTAGFRSTTMLYAMGLTQHTHGSQNVKSFAVLQTLMGNMGRCGGGINALRGIHNVQGSTDMGLLYHLIPGYSGNPGTGSSFGEYMDGLYGTRLGAKTKASLTIGAGDSAVTYTARFGGAGGNSIQVAQVNAGASQTLSVAVSGNDITVTLGTDSGSIVTSTATQVAAAVNAAAASALIVTAVAGGTGAGVAAEAALAALSGGATNYTNAYTFTNGGLQQKGFWSMTKAFFGDSSYREVRATVTIGTGDAAVRYRAVTGGTDGNNVRVRHVDLGADESLSVSVVGNDITVRLATDASGAVTSTANAVMAAVNAHGGASALVTASVPGTGTGIVSGVAFTALAGGANAVAAAVTCGTGDAAVTYTADTAGTAGNAIRVEHIDPLGASQALAVSVAGNDITVSLETDGDSNVISTAAEVATAVNAHGGASALVDAVAAVPGTTIVATVEFTSLAGGADAVAAAVTSGTGDAAVTYTADTPGAAGNSIRVKYVDGGADQSLSVSVAGNDITVRLATDASGAVTSTATQVKDAVNAHVGASALVDAVAAVPGAGIVATVAFSSLAGALWLQGYSETASALSENQATMDALYGLWPRTNGDNHIMMFRKMALGDIKAAVVWGQNPAISEPNQSKVRAGLKNLETLVVVDMFETETAACDRKDTGVTYLIPACSYIEEAGSVTNSGRALQWRYQAVAPRGNSKTDMELLLRLAKALDGADAFNHIKAVWNAPAGLNLGWTDAYAKLYGGQYGWTPGGGAFDSQAAARKVYKQMCAPLNNGGTLWIYLEAWDTSTTSRGGGWLTAGSTFTVGSGTVTYDGTRAASRGKADVGSTSSTTNNGNRLYKNWGFAWLVNRRVLYSDGAVPGDQGDNFQGPELVARMFVSTKGSTYTPDTDVIDYGANYRHIHRLSDVPKKANGDAPAFHVLPGRFPAHTEPYETPKSDWETWGKNSTSNAAINAPGAGNLAYSGTTMGDVSEFPLVLTSIRCVEHFQGGPTTRNNPANVEVEPEPWVEIHSQDASALGIKTGDYVNVITARSNSTTEQQGRTAGASGFARGFRARVGVGTNLNQRVGKGVVAIPWHWGDRGLGTGSRANDLCIDAMDANTTIPEYKACLCKIVKIG